MGDFRSRRRRRHRRGGRHGTHCRQKSPAGQARVVPRPGSKTGEEIEPSPLGVFGKYLSVWVLLCMVTGTVIGYYVPSIPAALSKATFYNIDALTAILIWLMIFPMMLQVRLDAIRDVPKRPGGVIVCTVMNWAIQPFVMYGLAVWFFRSIYGRILDPATQDQYVAGSVLLGGSPCTAMVFVWSKLAGGDPEYTLVQVALNDLLLLALYVPIVVGLLQISSINLPWGVVIVSVVLFVLVPFIAGAATRRLVLKYRGEDAFKRLCAALDYVTMVALLVMLVTIFVFQGETIVNRWFHILLIAVPLELQTFACFAATYGTCYLLGLPYSIAAPAAFIGASNFFELAVSVAVTVYGGSSGAAAATVVGVLTEVPTMLALVWFCKRTRTLVDERAARRPLQPWLQRAFGANCARCLHGEEELRSADETPLPKTPKLLPGVAAAVAEIVGGLDAANGALSRERRARVEALAACVRAAIDLDPDNLASGGVRLVYVCTHNSRRSQFAQVWMSVAAAHFGVSDRLRVYSAGTAVTEVNPAVVRTLEAIGFEVSKDTKTNKMQPVYRVRYAEDPATPALVCYSKLVAEAMAMAGGSGCLIPVCSDADESCPVVRDCICRVGLPYADPKVADGLPTEETVYSERSRAIATEAFLVLRLASRGIVI